MLKWTWVSAIVVFLDQLTKWTAEANLTFGVPHAVMPHLNFTLVYNYGAAFSFLGDQDGWQRWFFAGLALVISVFIIAWLKTLQSTEKWTAAALALVLGGAIGNLIDRVMNERGGVVDFIDFYMNVKVPYLLPNGHFATFNIADVAITMGAVLLIVISLFGGSETSEKAIVSK